MGAASGSSSAIRYNGNGQPEQVSQREYVWGALGRLNLGIVPGFQNVAQAVALNEYRGDTFRRLPDSTGAFPLVSIMGGTAAVGQERIEMGFIGAHADIGGGFRDQENALPLVALNWMIEQARVCVQ